MPRTKKIPHHSTKFEAGKEDRIEYESLHCLRFILYYNFNMSKMSKPAVKVLVKQSIGFITSSYHKYGVTINHELCCIKHC